MTNNLVASGQPVPRLTGMRWISLFKLFKGCVLLLVAFGVLSLLNKDADEMASRLVASLRVDPDNRYIHWLLSKLSNVDNRKLEQIGAGSFFYAALLLTEGTGLWFKKRWAEYFTVIATGSFLPLEIYELVHHTTALKVVVLILNVLIVWYLVVTIRKGSLIQHREERP